MFASTLAFVLFGLVGIILAPAFFPLLRVAFWRSKAQKLQLARQPAPRAFASFVALIQFLAVPRYQISARERLNCSGLLMLANHLSLSGSVFLIALVANLP